jgi:hypothetical protein
VGIGTASPSVDLELMKVNSGGYGPVLAIVNKGSGAGTAAAIRFGVDPSDINGGLPGAGTDWPNGEIKAVNKNTTGGNDTDLAFSVWNGGALNESVHIQGRTGYVGIGTPSPTARLHVEDQSYDGVGVLGENDANGIGVFGENGGTGQGVYGYARYASHFYTANTVERCFGWNHAKLFDSLGLCGWRWRRCRWRRIPPVRHGRPTGSRTFPQHQSLIGWRLLGT